MALPAAKYLANNQLSCIDRGILAPELMRMTHRSQHHFAAF
jgi:hypothetical protein